MDVPHATVSGEVAGHDGTHTQRPPEHVWPLGQYEPVPHDGPPGHTLSRVVPHATVVSEVVGQRGAHSQ